ncbi:MAG: Coenzyme F420 hydrogenase/dehydrogenase, beta subunit C-terminal domain [Desulfobacterales bacterium]|nr:MAG: Coenzyme F420 hydrogenase/dehydrogenase, beta subunit C-terminal domain [Desulfobacterales bacterium]
MRIYGSKELVNDVAKRDLCIGCGMCVNICPYFKTYKGKSAMLFSCTLEQGRCNAHCPKTEVDLDGLSRFFWNEPYDGAPLGRFKRILAARAGKRISGDFQGGGSVSALVAYALDKKLVNGAVLTAAQGIEPVARLVTESDQVAACAGSKFIAAPTLTVLNQATREGARKLAVVGTPCQMTAVAQMRMNPLEREDFEDPIALAVGVFCNWALDHRQLVTYLSERMDIAGITGMDIPPPPAEVLVVKTSDGEKRFSLKEIRRLIPHTCFICPDMTAEWTDVSVGMYEGRPGWNTLLIRTQTGSELVDRAEADGWLVTEAFPKENEQALSRAALAKKERSFRNADRHGLLRQEGENFRPALRVPPEVLARLIGPGVG